MKTRIVVLPFVATAILATAMPAVASRYKIGTVSMAKDGTIIFHLNVSVWKSGPLGVPVDLRISRGSPSYDAVRPLAGALEPGHTAQLPPWKGYIGLVAMSKDRTITYYARFLTNDVGDALFESVFPPGNLLGQTYAQHVGGLEPGDVKPVPPWPESIGTATMLSDGTIKLYLRSEAANGLIAEGVVSYVPSDPMYAEVERHVGGLKPGEEKPVPPWPASGRDDIQKAPPR